MSNPVTVIAGDLKKGHLGNLRSDSCSDISFTICPSFILNMNFLNEYHLSGLFIGICTFLIIGIFHPIVVKAEYYWGTKCWWIFLLLGIGGTVASLCTENILIASLLGVFAFSSFWTIKEVFEQEERVKKGWFPKNPKRTYKF